MEIDMTQLTDDVASKVWDSLNTMGLEAPFEEQNSVLQFSIKAKVLPVIIHTLPIAERHVKDKLIGIINAGHENKLSPDEILLSLTMELS